MVGREEMRDYQHDDDDDPIETRRKEEAPSAAGQRIKAPLHEKVAWLSLEANLRGCLLSRSGANDKKQVEL